MTLPFGLPPGKCDVQIFRASGTGALASTGDRWHTWLKPRGCKMTYIWSLGSGSGGGGGCSGASGTNRGGGSGGNAQGFANLLLATYLLPDRLYVRVPPGGAGGAADNDGLDGEANVVSVAWRSVTAADLVLLSGNSAGAGKKGTSAGGGNGGTGNSVDSTLSIFSGMGLVFFSSTGTTSAGGAHTGAAGTSIAQLASMDVLAGRGGAGVGTGDVGFAGGAYTAGGILPAVAGGIAGTGSSPAAGNGNQGIFVTSPWITCGGTGGGSNGTGVGGNGGDAGGPGSGGGGGGGGTTGGTGGRGGDGLVIIVSW